METTPILAWTFVSECPIPNDLGPILVEGEQPWAAYKTFRDSAIFTNKRHFSRRPEQPLMTRRAGHPKVPGPTRRDQLQPLVLPQPSQT